MRNEDLKRALHYVYPEECLAVGEELLEKLVADNVVLKSPSRGQHFGSVELELLNNALGVLSSLFTIYVFLAGSKQRPPTADQLAKEAESQGIDHSKVTVEETKKLCDQVVASKHDDQSPDGKS